MINDLDVLKSVLTAEGGQTCWEDAGRFNIRGSVPKSALKRLASEGYVEIETRRMSPWHFGPKQPQSYKPVDITQSEWNKTLYDYDQWHRDNSHLKTLHNRTEICVKITPRGIEYATLMCVLD